MNQTPPGVRRVLVVDEDASVTDGLKGVLASAGYFVQTAHDATTAVDELRRTTYDAALVDLRLGRESGYAVLERTRELDDPPAFLMMSGRADVAAVVTAMRRGGADFIHKPVDASALVARLEQALDRAATRRRRNADATELRAPAPVAVVGGAMRHALALADKVAATPSSSALLVGESGVGKEVIAARIHNSSARRDGPFVRVNLAAVSESVLEAELFGSIKGAYTDSKSSRAGYLATAHGGTILLDEIGEFRICNQAKLLRVLEERRFFPVGSDRERAVDVRVLAATNRDPRVMLEEGLLRTDLFYRLGSIIRIPPLRERPEEILELAEHFLRQFCAEFGRPGRRLTPASEKLLEGYAWPGNVRQLRNAIERAVMVTDGDEISAEVFDLPPGPVTKGALVSPARTVVRKASAPHRLHEVRGRALEVVEREQILRALRAAGGSRTRAADILGLSRSTLYDRLKRYDIK